MTSRLKKRNGDSDFPSKVLNLKAIKVKIKVNIPDGKK